MNFHGNPCWYELGVPDLDRAGAFYGAVLAWEVTASGMEGVDYRLARRGGSLVAGLTAGEAGAAPAWLVYIAADDCDAAAARVAAAGGQVLRPPADIPGTGRFAIVADPQGAAFGILEPDLSRMSPADMAKAQDRAAFAPRRPGHGAWHELMTRDLEAGFDFYADLFGWAPSGQIDMGEAGPYRIVARSGRAIAGMMGLGAAPAPLWLPYFGVASVKAAIRAVSAAGGTLRVGPMQVPTGDFTALATDDQGVWFGLLGGQ